MVGVYASNGRIARKLATLVKAAAVVAAALLAAARDAHGQLTALPGGTADFKFSFKPSGAPGFPTTWAPKPAPAGQLPSEMLQIGHFLPTLGAQTIVGSSGGLTDPPTKTAFQAGPFPSFGFGFDSVSNGPLGISWFGDVIDPPFPGSAGLVSETNSHGHVVIKNTSTSTLHFLAGARLASAGFAMRGGGFVAESVAGKITATGGAGATPAVYTPSLEAAFTAFGGPSYFGAGGMGPAALPPDYSSDFTLKTPFTFLYFAVRAKLYDLTPGGTLDIDGSVTRYADGALGIAANGGDGSVNGGSGVEEFFSLPDTSPLGVSFDASRGAAVIWGNQTQTGNWDIPNNWNPGNVPNPQANILFETQGVANGGGLVQLAGPRSAASLTFFNEIGQYTIDPVPGQNTLTLADAQGNGAVTNWSDSIPQINANVQTPNTLNVRTVIDSRETNFNGFVNAGGIKLTGSGAVNFNGATHANVITTDGNGALNFNGPVAFNTASIDKGAIVNINGPQSHAPGSLIAVQDGAVNMNSDAGAFGSPTTRVQLLSASASANFNVSQHLTGLEVTGGRAALVTPPLAASTSGGGGGGRTMPGSVIRTGSLAITSGGTVDLGTGALIVDYTAGSSPLPSIQASIRDAHNGGAWNGSGLTSSSADASHFAIGYGEASAIFGTLPATFAGEPVDDTTVIAALTRYGDTDFDGAISLLDFNRLASSFGQSGRVWTDGDFNYDGTVNLQDFNLLAGNFGLSAGPDGVTPQDWANLSAAVPEPTMVGLPFAAIASLLSRRRGRRAAL